MLLNMIRTALKNFGRVVRPTSINFADQTLFQGDIARQQKLLAMHRSLLAEYLRQQQAWEWMEVPDFLRFGIKTLHNRIMKVKRTLRGWDVEVSDFPDDGDLEQDLKDDIVGDIQHQRELLRIYRKNLVTYVRQRQQLSAGQASTLLIKGIEHTQHQIQRIKGILRGFGVVVDDLPGEEAS